MFTEEGASVSGSTLLFLIPAVGRDLLVLGFWQMNAGMGLRKWFYVWSILETICV